jgi:hypothetical protein
LKRYDVAAPKEKHGIIGGQCEKKVVFALMIFGAISSGSAFHQRQF